MRTTKKKIKNWFTPVAVATLVGGALLLALNMPRLISFRNQLVDHFITQAQSAKTNGDRKKIFANLDLASNVSFGDTRASRLKANELIAIYRYDQAEAVLAGSPGPINYTELGDIAIKAQHYQNAERYYSKANRAHKDSANLSGIALALIGQGKTKEGCDKNEEAVKSNLANKVATKTADVCKLLQTNTNDKRSLAYNLVELNLFAPAEKTLLSDQNKQARDWLILAQIAASRGEYERAVERVEFALKLDDRDINILKFAIIAYQNTLDFTNLNDSESSKLNSKLEALNTKILHIPSY